MEYSKKTAALARLHGIEGKDVLFALLANAGASMAEAFAVIFRPAATTNTSLATKASTYIGQRPGLRKLLDELAEQNSPEEDQPRKRAGRPRKDTPTDSTPDKPIIDYTDKDAVLQELARIAERSDNDNSRLAALREIGNLQRMKMEQNAEKEKQVTYFIPMDDASAAELLGYLRRYYAEKDTQEADS